MADCPFQDGKKCYSKCALYDKGKNSNQCSILSIAHNFEGIYYKLEDISKKK